MVEFTEREKELLEEMAKAEILRNTALNFLAEVNWSKIIGEPKIEMNDNSISCLGAEEPSTPATKRSLVIVLEWEM